MTGFFRIGVNTPVAAVHQQEHSRFSAPKLGPVNVSATHKVQMVATSTIDRIWDFLEVVKKVVSFKQLTDILFAPAHLYQISLNTKVLFEGNVEKKIDASLDIVESCRGISENSATFVVGLEEVGAIAVASSAWATPFAAVMTVVSVAGIIRNIRRCIKINKIMKEFTAAIKKDTVDGKYTLESYRSAMQYIESKHNEDEDFISEVFNISSDKLAEAMVLREMDINDKCSSSDPEDNKAGDKLLQKTLKSLKGRVDKNLSSYALAITSGVIAIIGSILLLACPVVPVGWAFIGVSVALEATSLAYHKVSEYQFAHGLGFERKWYEWLMC